MGKAEFEQHAPFHQELLGRFNAAEHAHHASTPIRGLNPTIAHFSHSTHARTSHDIGFTFKTRNNRKGRHQLTLSQSANAAEGIKTPRPSTDLAVIARGTWRMFAKYPVGDISWWVAYLFVWGSIVWVLNAMFVFLPEIRPSSEFAAEILQGGGITAFIGATIFEVGSVLLILEAFNEERSGCFGWAVEQVLSSSKSMHEKSAEQEYSISPSASCKHKYHTVHAPTASSLPLASDTSEAEHHEDQQQWKWIISWRDLRSHYIRELGFLACSAQLFGASVFWIAGFTALPGINNVMSLTLVKWIYWSPQVCTTSHGRRFKVLRTLGSRRIRLCHLWRLIHARDTDCLVQTKCDVSRLAHWRLESHWRYWIHHVWCVWLQ